MKPTIIILILPLFLMSNFYIKDTVIIQSKQRDTTTCIFVQNANYFYIIRQIKEQNEKISNDSINAIKLKSIKSDK